MHVHNIIASKSPTTGLPLLIYMWEESPGTIFSGPKGSSDHPSPDLYVELSSFIPFYHHKSQASLPPLLYSAILQLSWELALLSPEKLIMWVMNFFILSGGMCHQSQYPNRIAVEGSILSLWSDGSNWPQELICLFRKIRKPGGWILLPMEAFEFLKWETWHHQSLQWFAIMNRS